MNEDVQALYILRSVGVYLRLGCVLRSRSMPNVLGAVKHTECQARQKVTWWKQARDGSKRESSSSCKKGGILITARSLQNTGNEFTGQVY